MVYCFSISGTPDITINVTIDAVPPVVGHGTIKIPLTTGTHNAAWTVTGKNGDTYTASFDTDPSTGKPLWTKTYTLGASGSSSDSKQIVLP